jgi:gamma-glutamyl-gamma-aminobutyrate hydrolase PuuD
VTSTKPCQGLFEWDVKRLAASLTVVARARDQAAVIEAVEAFGTYPRFVLDQETLMVVVALFEVA